MVLTVILLVFLCIGLTAALALARLWQVLLPLFWGGAISPLMMRTILEYEKVAAEKKIAAIDRIIAKMDRKPEEKKPTPSRVYHV